MYSINSVKSAHSGNGAEVSSRPNYEMLLRALTEHFKNRERTVVAIFHLALRPVTGTREMGKNGKESLKYNMDR